ncbi:MAG: hypothetical protein M0006_01335 [Magnetospirillum sp.]|nr:hypothetical protein [Magnetospirillum sp.]
MKKGRLPTIQEAMEENRKAFVEKFGREPEPNDPVLFDPDADTPQPIDPERLQREMLEVLKAAGIPDELIFAYERTGLMVSELNQHLLSDRDIAEWNAAIDEYFRLHPKEGGKRRRLRRR